MYFLQFLLNLLRNYKISNYFENQKTRIPFGLSSLSISLRYIYYSYICKESPVSECSVIKGKEYISLYSYDLWHQFQFIQIAGRPGDTEDSFTISVENDVQSGAVTLHKLKCVHRGVDLWDHIVSSKVSIVAGSRLVRMKRC